MSLFATSEEGEKVDIVPNRWVRFTRSWDWDLPNYRGRATKTFAAGVEIRLTREQLQSAKAAGAVVCIPNPRHAAKGEAPCSETPD